MIGRILFSVMVGPRPFEHDVSCSVFLVII